MFTKLRDTAEDPGRMASREGEIYKVIEYGGRRFEIRYGYYEEQDRKFEPMPIYPDFIAGPVCTREGNPFVTAIQIPCGHFRGAKDENSTCEDCDHYRKCEELLGICLCSHNHLPPAKAETPMKGA